MLSGGYGDWKTLVPKFTIYWIPAFAGMTSKKTLVT